MTIGRSCLAIAVAVFVAMNLVIGLHPDDIKIISEASQCSYGELWTSPFLDRFYRPIVVTIVRASLDAFDTVVVPLRILQGGIAACVYTVVKMLEGRLAAVARYSGGLVLLASPLTFVSVSLFAVGMGDLIVGLTFLLAVRVCLADQLGTRTAVVLVGYTVLALFSKESGVLVAAYCAYETGRRRHDLACVAICAAALGYLALRATFVSHGSFEFSTGYFFETYSIAELNEKFGESPARLYAYNIVANLTNALVGLPARGQLRFPLHAALLVPATTLTTLLIARYLTVQHRWRAMAPLVGIVVVNAMIGFAYVRSRIMFVGAFSIAVLLMFTLDDLWTRSQRVAGVKGRTLVMVAVGIWICVLVHSLARLRLQQGAAI